MTVAVFRRWSQLAFVLLLVASAFGLSYGPAVCAGTPSDQRILMIGAVGDRTHRALEQLGLTPVVVPPQESALRQENFFAYSVIISGFDVRRDVLSGSGIRERLLKAIEYGTVFLGFRDWGGQDAWLPVAAKKDGAFGVSEIIAPEHPILLEPNRITLDLLKRVHFGFMYGPFVHLGEGWIPIVGGNQALGWFLEQRGQPQYPGEMHYGLVELPYGKGRIVLSQLIPEYDWFDDNKGSDTAPGKHLFENLLHYALKQSALKQRFSEPASVPAAYLSALSTLLDVVQAPAEPEMRLEQWQVETTGRFNVLWDDRDIVTIRHPHEPSAEGGFARLSRRFSLTSPNQGRTLLAFYVSDDYRGGSEPQFVGDRSVGQTQNVKPGYRFVEVYVDGHLAWQQDVLGPNPYHWPDLFHVVDITDYIQAEQDVEVSIAVVDRQGSGDPFWTDVFVSRVRLLESVPGREGPGPITVPADGRYVPVALVTDAPAERGTLRFRQGDETRFSVQLTADDLGEHWVAGEPMYLTAGERVSVELLRHGSEDAEEQVHQVYLVPERYLAPPASAYALPDVRSWFGGDAHAEQIQLHVKGPPGVDIPGPVVHGIPFAQGHVFPDQLTRIQLLNAHESPVAVQTRPLAFWPDGSVKWLLISFQGSPGPYVLKIAPHSHPGSEAQTAPNRSGPYAEAPPLVRPVGTHRYAVDTGRLKLVFNVEGLPRAERLWVDGREMGEVNFDFTITYPDGQRLSLGQAQLTEVRLVENGPERSLLWMRGRFLAGSTPDLEYTLQWHFYRDQPVVQVEATFTNRLGRKVELSDIRFHLDGVDEEIVRFPTEEGIESAQRGVWSLVQVDDRNYRVYDNGKEVRQGRRFPGWLTAHSQDDTTLAFFAGVRHFWEQAPKSVVTTKTGLEFGLWAKEAGEKLEVADGFQKSHQLLFGWVAPETASAWSRLLYQPYLLAVDPAYLIGTGALGPLSEPAAFHVFPLGSVYESSVERLYHSYLDKREMRREYGMQNFGDDTFEWGYGPVYTFWSNQEYDRQYGFLIQYLRAQDERFWQLGDQAARHYRDVDVIHHSTNPLHMGAPRAHNTKHVVETGWYPDHNLGGVSVTHAWVEGLWLHYLLTGDELTGEAARKASDWFVAEVERDRWGAGGPERGPGWTLIALVGAYRATSDERYLRAAQKVAADVFLHQDPVRGVYSAPISEQPSYEGGTVFMTGILGRGLARLYLETGDVQAALATERLYQWLTREARLADNRFFYKQAPNWRTPTSDNQIVSLLAYGLAFSDQPSDWPMVLMATRLQADIRSLAWMPEALALLEKLYQRYRR